MLQNGNGRERRERSRDTGQKCVNCEAVCDQCLRTYGHFNSCALDCDDQIRIRVRRSIVRLMVRILEDACGGLAMNNRHAGKLT